MTNLPWDENRKHRQSEQPESAETPETPETVPEFQCPYGYPKASRSKGSRTLLVILVSIGAAFILGFGGYAIFLAATESFSAESFPSESNEPVVSSQEEGTGESEVPSITENPVGTGTDPDFAGLTLADDGDDSYDAPELYQRTTDSVAKLIVNNGTAVTTSSAIVMTEDGYLLTTARSLSYSRTCAVSVVLSDGVERQAVVVGYDNASNLAVVKIDRTGLEPAVLGSVENLAVGAQLYTVSVTSDDGFHSAITGGMVSSKERTVSYDSVSGKDYLQIDGSVASGGAVLDSQGHVIGLGLSGSDLGSDYEGSGYAIPMEQAISVFNDLVRSGYVSGKVRIGIIGSALTEAEADYYQVPQGIVILELTEDSSFQDTDVEVGDIITEMDGQTVTDMSDLSDILADHRSGDTVEVKLYRMSDTDGTGATITVTITLMEDTGQTQS